MQFLVSELTRVALWSANRASFPHIYTAFQSIGSSGCQSNFLVCELETSFWSLLTEECSASTAFFPPSLKVVCQPHIAFPYGSICSTKSSLLRPHLFYRGLSPHSHISHIQYCPSHELGRELIVRAGGSLGTNPCIRPLASLYLPQGTSFLFQVCMAAPAGFEPAFSRVTVQCDNQLHHGVKIQNTKVQASGHISATCLHYFNS